MATCCSTELLVFAFRRPVAFDYDPDPRAEHAIASVQTSPSKTDQRVGTKFAEHPTSEPFCTRIGDWLVRCVHRIQRQFMLHAPQKKRKMAARLVRCYPICPCRSRIAAFRLMLCHRLRLVLQPSVRPRRFQEVRDRQRMSHAAVCSALYHFQHRADSPHCRLYYRHFQLSNTSSRSNAGVHVDFAASVT